MTEDQPPKEDQLPRLRTTRAGNKGVVAKLIAEAETILHDAYPLKEKARNRLAQIEKVLKEKSQSIHHLNDKIIVVCKVEDIEEEIEFAEDLKLRVMDAIEAISLGTMPITMLSSSGPSTLPQGTNNIQWKLLHQRKSSQPRLVQADHLTSLKETTPFSFLLHLLDRIQRAHNNIR